MRLVTAMGRGSRLAPAGEGVSSRPRAHRTCSWLYSRSNSQAATASLGGDLTGGNLSVGRSIPEVKHITPEPQTDAF